MAHVYHQKTQNKRDTPLWAQVHCQKTEQVLLVLLKTRVFCLLVFFFFNRDAEGKAQVQTGCMEKADTGTPAQGGGQQGRGVS